MKSITSFYSITSIEGFSTWLSGPQAVSATIGKCGGRRIRKEGYSGSIAIKDLVRKAEIFAHLVSEKEKSSFDQILEKIKDLDDLGNQAFKNANRFQRALTQIRQFFGNWGYCWQKELSLLPNLSEAFASLHATLPDSDRKIWGFVRANIKEMIEKTKEGEDAIRKYHPLDEKTVWLKSRFEDHILRVYLRIPRSSGRIKAVEQQIVICGPDKGSYAYYKPVQIYDGKDIKSNLEEMGKEYTTVQNMRKCAQILSMDIILKGSRMPVEVEKIEDSKKIKALRSPWADVGDLHKVLNRRVLKDEERFQVAIDIATALQKMHAENEVHLDLKAENILISKELRALVADFGRVTSEGKTLSTIITTYAYAAPEMLSSLWKVEPANDMWAFGLILLDLFYGLKSNLYRSSISKHISSTKNEFEDHSKFPEIQETWQTIHGKIVATMNKKECAVRPLIEKLLDFDPDRRPSAQESVEELSKLANF